MSQQEQRQALVDTFINAIYLYDDKVLITFNYKEGTETVTFGEAAKAEESSDMSARGAPDIERQIVRFDVLFLLYHPEKSGSARSMHGFCTVVIFASRFCKGRNCLKMCVRFCIRSAVQAGAWPLLWSRSRCTPLPTQRTAWQKRSANCADMKIYCRNSLM